MGGVGREEGAPDEEGREVSHRYVETLADQVPAQSRQERPSPDPEGHRNARTVCKAARTADGLPCPEKPIFHLGLGPAHYAELIAGRP